MMTVARGGTVLAVVCPNGLGHFRRTTEVLRRVLAANANVRTVVVCETWQVERSARMEAVSWLREDGRTTWVHEVMAPGVGWSADPDQYRDGRLHQWLGRLKCVPEVENADLILSDNLVGVLQLRPDTVLQGSFLWSTVLEAAHPTIPAVIAFAAWERSLLERCQPPMLCVRRFAMPDVLKGTRAVELPWMCSETVRGPITPRREIAAQRVLTLGGATGAGDESLARAVKAVAAMGAVELVGPAGRVAGVKAIPFGYSESEFRMFDAALCRPAMGTIHDCIASGLPMICCSEPGNIEMEHNARVVEAEGLGVDVGSAEDARLVQRAVTTVLRRSEAERIRYRMAEGRKDGLDVASRWLLARLLGRTSSGGEVEKA